MKATAKVACMLPRPLGYVFRGATVDLAAVGVDKWDEKKFAFLVNFEPTKAPQAKTDNDPLK